MTTKRVSSLAIAGVVAGLYAALSLALFPFSFGVYQVRVAEALTVIPFLTPAAVPGLFVGCVVANIFGGMGWLDIVIGSLITLIAAGVTRWIYLWPLGDWRKWLAPLPPVLFNAFGVSVYLAPIIGVDYWFAVQMIGVGQCISCYVIGMPLLMLLDKRKAVLFN
ncbi:QueT transporter family protein [bacterium]|nr:QueT transporter family protein [bacterium]MCB2201678.1 QueT transporter family protein [bacterium]